MARDLIPPPSPAGRPQPEGTPRLIELPPEPAPVVEAPPEPQGPLPPTRFRNRFGFLMGALAGVVVVATAAIAIVLSTGGDDFEEGLAPNWSKWRPSDTSIEVGATEIAERVGAKYKHSTGQQLVLVQPSALPEGYRVALRSGGISVIEDEGVIYYLNGLGPNNSLRLGTPSTERLKVLQREGLELALYTFRYVPDAGWVLVILPPPPPKATPTPVVPGLPAAAPTPAPNEKVALFYRPGDLLPHLQVPLGETVPADAPTPETLDPIESRTIDTLTNANRFLWSVQADNGLLVLERPPQG
jgi:hypothetical protein